MVHVQPQIKLRQTRFVFSGRQGPIDRRCFFSHPQIGSADLFICSGRIALTERRKFSGIRLSSASLVRQKACAFQARFGSVGALALFWTIHWIASWHLIIRRFAVSWMTTFEYASAPSHVGWVGLFIILSLCVCE